MKVEMPLGDVVDRVTILRLKEARIDDAAKVVNVRAELQALRDAWAAEGLPPLDELPEWPELCDVNGRLWDVEDAIRDHERRGDFGTSFVALARDVYVTNDRRAELKRAINLRLGSTLVEEKSYADYRTGER